MSQKILGLIAGNGKFPFAFAKEAKSQGYKVIAIGIKGDTSVFLRFFVDEIKYFYPGDLMKAFEYCKNSGMKKVIMAGQIAQDRLFDDSLNFDKELSELFNALKDRKADTIFSAFAEKFKAQGIELMDSTFLVKQYLAQRGTLTSRKPSKIEEEDIEFGRELAKSMGKIDVGQTVVVKEKAIVAIEAMEGTDKTILRGGHIARNGAVVVKMSKPEQDVRFDVPVIGPRTIKSMIRSNAKCLAIEAGKTIIIDQSKCVQMANQAGISIISL